MTEENKLGPDELIVLLCEHYAISYNPELKGQLVVFLEALEIHSTRSVYGKSWQRYGALSNLLSMARKVDRLMKVHWHGSGELDFKAATDDAFDLINYAAFFIRNVRAKNAKGTL